MPMPTKRTPKVVEDILARLSTGETLNAICRSDDKFPHPETWRDWCDDDETLALAYARARDLGEEAIAAECLAIADTPEEGQIVTSKVDKDGNPYDEVRVEDMLGHRKLRIETRLKLLAIWNPKKYGAKLDVTTKDQPITASTDDIAARTASLLAAAKKRKDEAKDG